VKKYSISSTLEEKLEKLAHNEKEIPVFAGYLKVWLAVSTYVYTISPNE
jgi:hypothetical protein